MIINKLLIFCFVIIIVVLSTMVSSTTEPFTIVEKTEYGLTENIIYINVTENLDKEQIIDISSVFGDHKLTDDFKYSKVFMKQNYEANIYGLVNNSIGKYKTTTEIVYNDVELCPITGNLQEISYNKTIYLDDSENDMDCDFVLEDKSCLITEKGIIGTEILFDFLPMPEYKDKIVIDGLKISYKDNGLVLAKSSTIQIRYTVEHPVPYGLMFTEIDTYYNKYDIVVCSEVNDNECTVLDPTWYDSSWHNRKNITVDGVGLSISDNYQTRITVTYDSDMLANFSDLRFTYYNSTSETESEIDYFLESKTDSTTARVYVEIPETSNSSNITVYMYYNNSAAGSASDANATLSEGIVSLYQMSGNANDLVGINDASLIGSPDAANDKDGRANQAYYLDGGEGSIAKRIDIFDNASINFTDEVSYGGWVKIKYYDDAANARTIINKAVVGTSGYMMYYASTTAQIYCFIYGISDTTAIANVSIPWDEYHHYMCVYDGSNIMVYQDGVQVAKDSSTGSITTNDNNLYLNYYPTGLIYGRQTHDEIRFYNEGLTHAQINSMYTATEPTVYFGDEENLSVNSAPTTPNVAPTTNASISVDYQEITCSGSTDADADTIYYTIYGDYNEASPGTILQNTTGTTYNWTGLTDGYNYFRCAATDGIAYSNNTSIYYVYVDTIYPLIDFISPTETDNDNISQNYAYVNVSVSDDNDITAFIDWNKSLVGWWRFDNDTDFIDHSTHSNDATNGGSIYTEGGKFGGARVFDGSNDYVRITKNNIFNFTDINFSVSFWYKTATTEQSWDGLIDGASTGGNTQGFYFIYRDDTEGIRFLTGNGTGSNYVQSATGLTVTEWAFVTGIYNITHINLYINGIFVDNTIINYPYMYGDENLDIGHVWEAFNGTIDEVKIFNRVLSPEEINASYNAGLYRLENNFTGLDDGTYEYIAYVQDISGNVNETETRTINLDTSAPSISAYYQWNSTNDTVDFGVWTEGFVSINWNLTDTIGVNVSTCEIKVRNNDTTNGYTNLSYVDDLNHPDYDIVTGYKNLTCYSEDLGGGVTRVTANMTRSYDWRPINIPFEMDNAAQDNEYHNFGGRSTKMIFNNISNTINTTLIFLADIGNQTNTVADMLFYSCNSSYVDGDFTTNNNCAIVGAITTNASRDVNFDYVIGALTTNENGSYGGVEFTSTMYGLSYCPSCTNTGNSWITYSTNGYDGHSATSPNQGATWTNLTGQEFNVILHVIDNTKLEFNLTIEDDLGNQLNDLQIDLYGPLANLAPFGDINSDNVTGGFTSYYDIHGVIESGTICINVTVSDPNADTMNCSIYLLNNDSSYNQTLLTDYTVEGYGLICYQWDTTTISNGDYRLNVTANDGELIGYDESSGYVRIYNAPQIDIEYISPIVVDQYNTVNINISVLGTSDINYTLPFELSQINTSSLNLSNTTESNINFTLTNNYINFTAIANENYTLTMQAKPIQSISSTAYGGCPAPYIDYGDKCRYVISTDDRFIYYYSYYVNVTESSLNNYNLQTLNKSQSDMTDFGSYNLISLTINDSDINITEQFNNSYYNMTVNTYHNNNDSLVYGLYEVLLSYFVWTGETIEGTGSGPPGEDITPGNIEPNVTIIQPDVILYKKGITATYIQHINITNYNSQIVHYYINIDCIENDDICKNIWFGDEIQSFGFYLSPNQTTDIKYYLTISDNIENIRHFNITLSVLARDNMISTDYTKLVTIEPKRIEIIDILDKNIFPKDFTRPVFGITNVTVKEGLIVIFTILVIGFILNKVFSGD